MKISGYLSGIDLYVDTNDPTTVYGEVEVPAIGANTTTYSMFTNVDDEGFKSYLRQFVIPYVKGGVTPSAIIQEIKDILYLGGNPDAVEPRVRTAGSLRKELVEYDLNTSSHEYVVITPDGWEISTQHKHKFLKRNTLAAQVIPKPTNQSLLKLLAPFVNTNKKGLVLFATWLVQAFCVGNHSALLIMAEQGSGKSTLTKLARSIVDPSMLNATTTDACLILIMHYCP